MYTQCPNCSVAFSVTAEVLKLAAGKVRCGGCGSAFNALDFLSEKNPTSPDPGGDPAADGRGLAPDAPDELEPGRKPSVISAEQSAALLKTLDQIAGDDVRIEDTGVEWRVLDPEDADDNLPEHPAEEGPRGGAESEVAADETGSLRFLLQDEDACGDNEALEDGPHVIDERLHDRTDPPSAGTVDAASGGSEVRFDDNTPLPDDFDAGEATITPPATPDELQAEELQADESQTEESQVNLELGDAAEWEDLLGEVADTDAPEPEAEQTHTGDTSIEEDLMSAAFETEAAAKARDAAEAAGAAEVSAAESTTDSARERHADTGPSSQAGMDKLHKLNEQLDEQLAELDEQLDELDPVDDFAAPDETRSADSEDDERDAALASPANDDVDTVDAGSTAAGEVPELSEEEKTLNLMIDQDLLAIAVEDEDGFASTIVQKQVSDKDDIPAEKSRSDKFAPDGDRTPLVETIVMEGDFVRSELEREQSSADREAGAAVRKFFAHSKEATEYTGDERGNTRMIAGVVGLLLLFGAQIVHQSRESLATVPAINAVLGPLYRTLGQPVVPAWNIGGWRFEATKGSTDENDQRLTIFSRVGNTSDSDLPLPLMHVSLTDRYEEIVGSRVMEPAEYLVAGASPRQMIAPRQSFNAVIAIDSPVAEATGFKLNVCYRLTSGKLKCALKDFR